MIEKRPFFFATISLVLGEVVGQYANQMVRIAFYCIGLIGLFVLWYSNKYRKKTKKISRVYKKKGQRMPSALLSFFYILFLIGSIHNQYVQIVFSIPNGYEDGMEVYVIGTIIEKTKTDYGMTYRIQKPKIMKEDLTKKAAKKQTLENRTEQKNKNQPDQKEIDQLYQEETCSETTQAILGEKTEKEEGGQEQLRGDLLLYGLEEELELGQLIFAYGQLQTLAEPTNPGQFNQKKYQMARGVLGTIKKAKVKQKSVQGNAMIESIWKVREKINNGYRLVLDEKSAGLLMAMVTGERGMVDSEIKTLYQNQGIAHILAISGLHVAFVGRSVFRILRKRGISYGIAGSVAISFLCVYSIFVGKGASVVRGCIMLTMLLIGEIIGRSYDMITAMALAAVLLILENPYCIEDIGFLLSFGAIVGISICYPYYFSRKDRKHKKFPQNLDTKRGEQSRAKYWKNNKREEIKRKESENNNSDSHWDKEKQRKPYRVIKEQIGQLKEEKINKKTGEIIINKQNRRSWIRRQKESILVSLSIQMVTLPILLTSFYGFSPYSIFLNLFILPMMSLLLPSAMFGGIMTLCSFFWAKILLYPAVFVLHSYEWICRFMEQIPSSFVITGAPSIKFYLVYYMLLILGAILWKKRKKKEFFFSFFLGVMIILIDWQGEILARLPHSNTMITSKKLKILCADVGQGDGIVLKLPSKHYYLLDGGSTDVKNVGTYRLLPLLKYYGISTLEGAFVTHFDSDHYNGMQQLFGNIRIKKLFLPKLIEKDEEYIQFEQLAKSYHTEIFYVAEGDRLQDGTVTFHWLSPSLSNQKEDKNDNSQVFEIRYGKFQGLFTGDMGEEREQEILSSLSPCTFLKVGHHGSKYSSSEAFLQRIKPKYGVISYGVGNRYGHPTKEALERLEQVGTKIYETGKGGAIFIETDGSRIKVNTYES